MKMLIDKIKLRLLLEQKRNYIKNRIEGVDLLITDAIYIVSLLCCDFNSFLGVDEKIIQTLAWVLAFGIAFYGIFKLIRSIVFRFDHKMLFSEIENLDEMLHRFSIVAIKNDFEDFSNRFLLYFDVTWDCWFFFSFHTSEFQNEINIVQRLSNKLKLDVNKISVKYVSDRIQPKYSERDQVQKVYQHSLYQGVISEFTEIMKQNEFKIDGTAYKWFTIDEMEKNETIMQKNSDVVAYVKEKIC